MWTYYISVVHCWCFLPIATVPFFMISFVILFSWSSLLIIMFVFHILQIPGGSTAPTCTRLFSCHGNHMQQLNTLCRYNVGDFYVKPSGTEACNQTVNTMGVAASSLGAYRYMRLFMYIMLYYTHTVYTYYVCISVKSTFIRTRKSAL